MICPLVKPFQEWKGGNFHASKVFSRLTFILKLKIVWHPVLRNCPCILWAIYFQSRDSYAIYRVSFVRGKEGLLHYRYFIRNENEEKWQWVSICLPKDHYLQARCRIMVLCYRILLVNFAAVRLVAVNARARDQTLMKISLWSIRTRFTSRVLHSHSHNFFVCYISSRVSPWQPIWWRQSG